MKTMVENAYIKDTNSHSFHHQTEEKESQKIWTEPRPSEALKELKYLKVRQRLWLRWIVFADSNIIQSKHLVEIKKLFAVSKAEWNIKTWKSGKNKIFDESNMMQVKLTNEMALVLIECTKMERFV